MAQSISEAGTLAVFNDTKNLLPGPRSLLRQLCLEVCHSALKAFNVFLCGQMEVFGETRTLCDRQRTEAIGHFDQES